MLPDSPPPSTVAALASIANTVVRDAKRRRKQLSSDFANETRVWGISSPSSPIGINSASSSGNPSSIFAHVQSSGRPPDTA